MAYSTFTSDTFLLECVYLNVANTSIEKGREPFRSKIILVNVALSFDLYTHQVNIQIVSSLL